MTFFIKINHLPVFVIGFLIAFIGCAPQRPQNAIIIAQPAEPRSLDPQVSTGNSDFRISAQIFEGLVRFAENSLEIEPALAKSWSVSDDGKQIRFQLRENVTFHDGTPFNAEAVVFNFERIIDENHPYHHTGPFPLSFFFDSIQKIQVLSESEVLFQLDEPFAPLLSNLAYPTAFISSPSAIQQWNENYGRNPVGTGPFLFKSWESNRKIHLVENINYWDESPKLESVYFKPITDENTRLMELLSGNCDVVMEVPADIIDYFRNKSEFKIVESTGPHLWFLILNTQKPPFDNQRIRQAINLAIDKEGIVNDLLQQTASVPAGPISKAFDWAITGDTQPWPHDPAKAKRIIAKEGGIDRDLIFWVTESGSGMLDPKGMAESIQADLKEIGVNVVIESYEWNTYLSKVNAGLGNSADMAQMAWMTNDPDTLPYLALHSDALPQKGGFNSGYYQNEKLDALLEKGRREMDPKSRGEIYQQVQELVHNDAPWAFVASWKQGAVVRNAVSGFQLHPSFLFSLKNTTINNEEIVE